MSNLVEMFDDVGEKNDEAECTRSTQQINEESKSTINSIFDTNETDKRSQKPTKVFRSLGKFWGPKIFLSVLPDRTSVLPDLT